MNRVILRSLVFALQAAAAIFAFAQDGSKHPITFTDMIGMHRVAEPEISSDGKWVAYTVTTPDMDANRGGSNIWIVPTGGGPEMQLTRSGHDASPVWSPDGHAIAFVSSRGNQGVDLWSLARGSGWKRLARRRESRSRAGLVAGRPLGVLLDTGRRDRHRDRDQKSVG